MKQAREIKGVAEKVIQKKSTKILTSYELIRTVRSGYWNHNKNGRLVYREGMRSTIVEMRR